MPKLMTYDVSIEHLTTQRVRKRVLPKEDPRLPRRARHMQTHPGLSTQRDIPVLACEVIVKHNTPYPKRVCMPLVSCHVAKPFHGFHSTDS